MKLFTGIRWLLFTLLLIPAVTHAQTEVTSKGNVIYLKINNGLNAVLMPLPNEPQTEIALYVKTGSQYESDSLQGIANILETILAQKISNGLQNPKYASLFQNTVFTDTSTTEQAIFKITTTPANIKACLNLLKDSVFSFTITEAEIKGAINTVLREMEAAKYDNKKVLRAQVIKTLYGQDHAKMEPLGNPKYFPYIDRDKIKDFFNLYYVPNNSLLVVTGNFDVKAIQNDFPEAFSSLIRSEFDPRSVTRIINMRPMTYSSQFVSPEPVATPEFELYWQFPGTSANIRASRCAYLLNALLNDKNNFIQVKAAKMGCKKLLFDYEAHNFSGIFKVTIQPSKENLFATYDFVTKELARLDQTLLNETMINAARLQFGMQYDYQAKTKDYPQQIVKYWTYNDNTYYLELSDSVNRISEKELRSFVVDYIVQSPHLAVLRINRADRQALNVDSLFTDIDENVEDYVFRYRQNVSSIESNDDSLMLRNLLQWLRLNTDIYAQVNGFSDESEYNKATDDSIMQFIDSLPTFKKSKQDFIKKGYLPLGMMRSMKIIKYLYDNGIAPGRLSGTSMAYSSDTKEEEEDNRKCTLTLDKYHQSPSLFEFHYGRKKE